MATLFKRNTFYSVVFRKRVQGKIVPKTIFLKTEKLDRSLFKLPDDLPLSNPDVSIVTTRVPNAKICGVENIIKPYLETTLDG